MRHVVCGLMVLAISGLAAAPAFAQRGGAANGWLSDYQQAKELAAKTGKPIFLYFRCVP